MMGLMIRMSLVLILTGSASCNKEKRIFRQLSGEESGVDFANQLSPSNELNILTYLYYYNGGGVMIADFNNDGLNDIYFASNQGSDKLFLNKGSLHFEDVTQKSGIVNDSGWTTGVTHVDINSDGLLDIYVSKVAGYRSIQGRNLLFVNQGTNADGIPVFREDAQSYGLDLSTLSTQSAFFDYDLDGDLDMFLLTHSVHPNRSYGRGENRFLKDSVSGDRLFENVDGVFVDGTDAAGIFRNRISYGLGLAISDLDMDGYPDIYVGNDFFENDYYYRNNRDKTYTELISKDPRIFGHTSHYSMGNCIADVNNDGRPDVISLDMLPEDLNTLKSSGVEDAYPTYQQFLKNGYAPQFMQNTLHLNRGPEIFSEVAFQSGIAATEWSWGVLLADFDMDGLRDVHITNGILGATNDMDYISFVSQEHIQRQIETKSELVTSDFIKQIPEKRVRNYMFRNTGNVSFQDVSDRWMLSPESFSNGSAYGDLDNDGDLDLVVNNINQEAFVYENLANNQGKYSYLTIAFNGSEKNRFGVGARVELYAGELHVFEENFPVKSFLSSVPNELTIGLGTHNRLDSIRVVWPDFSFETLYQVRANGRIVLSYENSQKGKMLPEAPKKPAYLRNVSGKMDFAHREQSSLDFDRDPLIPFASSNEGPDIAVADVNNDSRDDLFIGGAKMQSGELFIQTDSGEFLSAQQDIFEKDSRNEDVAQIFFDADSDGDNDLVVVSGGNEFATGEPLRPRLYINNAGVFSRDESAFPGVFVNASAVAAFDLENDGDLDLFISSAGAPGKFGEAGQSLLFINDGSAHFKEKAATFSVDLAHVGPVNDVTTADFDKNGFTDLLIVGDWIPLTFFMNDGKTLTRVVIPDTEGWWNAVVADDFDKDGDIDLVAGNWGLNTRLSASAQEPITLYRVDIDDNGATETLITYHYRGTPTFLASKDELSKQIPSLKKRFLSYRAFADADIEDVLPKDAIVNGRKRHVKILSTCYFENLGGSRFKRIGLPPTAQQSSVNDIYVDDFNKDGFNDLFLVGNNYEISTQLGSLDASHGVLLINDRMGFFYEHVGQEFNVAGPARSVEKVVIRGSAYYIVTINNGGPVFLKKEQ